MSDQPKSAVAFQGGAGQPPENPPEGGQEAAQQESLTRADEERIAEKAAEIAFRRAQGLIEKKSTRIEERVQAGFQSLKETLKAQRKMGVEITPAQETALRAEVLENAYTVGDQDPPPDPVKGKDPAQDPPPVAPVIDPVTAEAGRLMDAAGIEIMEDDPEAEAMREATTVVDFLKATEAGIEAKRSRLASEGGSPPRTPTNVGGTGGPPPHASEADYKKEMYAARGKGMLVGGEIKRKYRELGVPVDSIILDIRE